MNARTTVAFGTIYGLCTVLETLPPPGRTRCLVRCVCGTEKIVKLAHLKAGSTKSCGCLQVAAHVKHGAYGTPAHTVWIGLVQRTTNSKTAYWADYGGRGIAVCPAWKDFKNFLSDMGQPPQGLQLDRENNNLGYSKENCRWATPSKNSRNKRNNVIVQYAGRNMCLAEASALSGIRQTTLSSRLALGQTGPELFRPPRHYPHNSKKASRKPTMNIAILHPRALEALYPEAQYPEGYEAYPRSDYQEALARGDAAGLTYWQYVYRELKKEAE